MLVDRHLRGPCTDTQPYAIEREVDDLAALIAEAGESAYVYAFSSGGLLALHAATAGLPIPRMALLEPPIELNEDRSAQRLFTTELSNLLAAGQPERATEFYLTGIGVPEEIVASMRGSVSWSAMESIAPTFVYDSLISEATSFDLLASVTVPTLVLDSEGSSDDLTGMAAMVAGALPKGLHASTRAAPARCWTDSANASVVTSMSLTALSSSSRLATKNTRPPTTHDADRRIQSSLAGDPPRLNLPLLGDPPRPVVQP